MSDLSAPKRRKHALPAFTPVPRLKERSNGWKPEVQRAFIEALADTGSVRAACRRVNRSECGAYQMRRHPEGESFARAWEAALALGVQKLEDIAMDRALNGVEVPVYAYGKIIGARRVYNDKLLMFILRNRASRRFRAGGSGSAGRGGALKVVEQRKMKRLKKLWFEEWDADRIAQQSSSATVIREQIDRKLDHVRERLEAARSPRGHDIRLQAEAQSRADHEAGWRPGEPYAPYADYAAELYPQILEQLRADPENRRKIQWESPPTPLLEDARERPDPSPEG